MTADVRPLTLPPYIPETITYLEKIARGERVGRGRKINQIEELYVKSSKELYYNLLNIVKAWGDQPAVRQIIFFHYLQKEPLLKEMILECIYPGFKENRFLWKETELKFFLQQKGLTKSEQSRTLKIAEKALREVKMFMVNRKEKFLEYQRPAVEAVAYALYAEYSEGFEAGKRFSLKNPPLEQILKYAAFPAYFLLDPKTVPLILEACRIKNYISLESRGGLCQYALIYQDLTELVEYMIQGGHK
ncbi:hypothetical protein BBF96_04850 [Anoxybacter fermentans]|uniref:DUF1819 domain-containing protein n=1 Tax=Anoxybacter fermentans TaxID=1323375 RepID=A0A3Q9HPR3_9FIRM|nr:hypothetical protein [Anoxybacter fermentans]AZR72780.1 hypothetical protein BBF96_04850 [Anoxybacter fermentans]